MTQTAHVPAHQTVFRILICLLKVTQKENLFSTYFIIEKTKAIINQFYQYTVLKIQIFQTP
jgi:hypothetical protein